MKPVGLAIAAAALGIGLTFGSGFVPNVAGDAVAAAREDRAAARAARRAKRIECRREADAQKLRFFKRSRFLRTCNRP